MRSKFAENAEEIAINDDRYKKAAEERWERRKDLDDSDDEEGGDKAEGGAGGVMGVAADMGGFTFEDGVSNGRATTRQQRDAVRVCAPAAAARRNHLCRLGTTTDWLLALAAHRPPGKKLPFFSP